MPPPLYILLRQSDFDEAALEELLRIGKDELWKWTFDVGTLGNNKSMAHGRPHDENNILRLFDLQQGKGLIKVNGQPLSLVQPEILRFKVRTSNIPRQPNNNSPLQRTLSG